MGGSRRAGLPGHERERVALALVREQAAAVLGHASAEAVPAGRPFKELGFDSLAAVQLARRAARRYGVAVGGDGRVRPPDSGRAGGVSAARGGGRARGGEDRRARRARARAAGGDRGDGLPLPGAHRPLRSPEELWELLAAGGDAIGGFPADRGWDLEGLYDPDPDRPGTSYAREGGFLHDAGEFDAAFFGIGPREALAMDPQQRLLLEVCWEALEDAGIDPLSLRETRTGVFAGVGSNGYMAGADAAGRCRRVPDHGHAGERGLGPGGVHARAGGPGGDGRHGVLVFAGGAAPGDAVAARGRVHAGAGRRRGGDGDAGRVRRVQPPARPRPRTGAASRSPTPPTAPAGARAWACCCWSASPMRGAMGIEVLAVVRGSAVNQDGASNGLTAPNGPSQQRVILQALASAGRRARRGGRGGGARDGHDAGGPDRGAGAAGDLRAGSRRGARRCGWGR